MKHHRLCAPPACQNCTHAHDVFCRVGRVDDHVDQRLPLSIESDSVFFEHLRVAGVAVARRHMVDRVSCVMHARAPRFTVTVAKLFKNTFLSILHATVLRGWLWSSIGRIRGPPHVAPADAHELLLELGSGHLLVGTDRIKTHHADALGEARHQQCRRRFAKTRRRGDAQRQYGGLRRVKLPRHAAILRLDHQARIDLEGGVDTLEQLVDREDGVVHRRSLLGLGLLLCKIVIDELLAHD